MEADLIIKNCNRLISFFGDASPPDSSHLKKGINCLGLLNTYSMILDWYGAGSDGPLSRLLMDEGGYIELKEFGELNLLEFKEIGSVLRFVFSGYSFVAYKK